jgi:hypothetical protein
MDYKKYEDMAYSNPRGKKWLEALHSPEIWSRWVKDVSERSRPELIQIMGAEAHADRIVTTAIWHLGFAKDLSQGNTLLRCARRLRRPPDRGDGVIKGGGSIGEGYGMYNRIPREIMWLDDFLEYWVRPLVVNGK